MARALRGTPSSAGGIDPGLRGRDTTDRATNTVSSSRTGVRRVVSEYLTDTDNWWLLSRKDQHTLTWFNRQLLKPDSPMDSQTKDMLYDVLYRASVAFFDWRGVVGSNV